MLYAIPDKVVPYFATCSRNKYVRTFDKVLYTRIGYFDDRAVKVLCEQHIATATENKEFLLEIPLSVEICKFFFFSYLDKIFGYRWYTKGV